MARPEVMDLQDLMDQVIAEWPFNAENYPDLKGEENNPEYVSRFAIRHILQHQVKAVGLLAKVCERWDHGKDHPISDLHDALFKLFRNSLRMAALVNYSAQELIITCAKEG